MSTTAHFSDPLCLQQRAKLPKWIGECIKSVDTNLSTDLAIVQSKRFLRTMAQPFEQSSKSLWGLEQVLEKQRNGRVGSEDEEETRRVQEYDRDVGDAEMELYDGIDDEAMLAAEMEMEAQS